MKKLFIALSVLFFVAPAHAQEGVPPECRLVPDHKPSMDATYQPGVDVNGKPVVPADLNSNAPMNPTAQTIVVPLTVDLAKRLQGMNIQGIEMESTLGFLEIAPGGKITYNGQDLTNQVHVLCDQQTAKAPANPPPAANGQTPPNPVKYAPVKKAKPAAKATPPKPVAHPLKAPVPAAPLPEVAPKKEPDKGELIEGGDYQEGLE